jgi:lysophospholipase L1-like esterase
MKRSFFILLLLFAGRWLAAQEQNLHIVYIGDSITQGVQLDDPAEEAPPAAASAWLARQKGIGKVLFSNQGISGFTTVDFLPSGDTVFNKAEQAARSFSGQQEATLIFSISLGTNDSASAGPNGSPVSQEQYHDNLKAIIGRLLEDFPDSKIVIQLPVWYSPNTYNNSKYLQEGLTRLQSYFAQAGKLASEYALAKPGHVYASDNGAFGYFQEHYLSDLKPEQGREGTFYLHPNKKGAAALGVFWGIAIYQAARGGR